VARTQCYAQTPAPRPMPMASSCMHSVPLRTNSVIKLSHIIRNYLIYAANLHAHHVYMTNVLATFRKDKSAIYCQTNNQFLLFFALRTTANKAECAIIPTGLVLMPLAHVVSNEGLLARLEHRWHLRLLAGAPCCSVDPMPAAPALELLQRVLYDRNVQRPSAFAWQSA
jgi:hypothetical protein